MRLKIYLRFGLLLLGLSIFTTQAVRAVYDNSLTFDEPIYLFSGYYHWKTGKFDINTVHPPLAKMFFTLPLVLSSKASYVLDQYLPWVASRATNKIVESGEAVGAIYSQAPEAIWECRFMTLFLALLLISLIFVWAYELYGLPGAAISLFLCAFSPEFLGHSTVTALDLAVTLFITWSVYAYSKCLSTKRPLWTMLSFLGAAFAVGAKLSGLLVFPLFLIMNLADQLSEREIDRQYLGRLLRFFCGLSLFVCFFLHAIYGFSEIGIGDSAYLEFENKVPYAWFWTVAHFPFPLPHDLATGLLRLVVRLNEGAPVVLLGEQAHRGWWYYMGLAFLLKIPLGTLVIWMIAFVPGQWGGKAFSHAETFLLYPICLLFLFFSVNCEVTLGIRYGLPVLPFLMVFSGRLGPLLLAQKGMKKAWAMAALTILLASNVFSVLRVGSNYLAYFNELIPKDDEKSHYLCDSNLDWGQNLLRVRAHMKEQGWSTIFVLDDDFYLQGFGVAPRVYGIDARRPYAGNLAQAPLVVSACSKRDLALFFHSPSIAEQISLRPPYVIANGAIKIYPKPVALPSEKSTADTL